MIKRFVVLRRKKGLSVEAFHAYWRTVHGPLIAAIPGVRKYVQYHVRSEIRLDEDEPIDGIAKLWFDSEEGRVGGRGRLGKRPADQKQQAHQAGPCHLGETLRIHSCFFA